MFPSINLHSKLYITHFGQVLHRKLRKKILSVPNYGKYKESVRSTTSHGYYYYY